MQALAQGDRPRNSAPYSRRDSFARRGPALFRVHPHAAPCMVVSRFALSGPESWPCPAPTSSRDAALSRGFTPWQLASSLAPMARSRSFFGTLDSTSDSKILSCAHLGIVWGMRTRLRGAGGQPFTCGYVGPIGRNPAAGADFRRLRCTLLPIFELGELPRVEADGCGCRKRVMAVETLPCIVVFAGRVT